MKRAVAAVVGALTLGLAITASPAAACPGDDEKKKPSMCPGDDEKKKPSMCPGDDEKKKPSMCPGDDEKKKPSYV